MDSKIAISDTETENFQHMKKIINSVCNTLRVVTLLKKKSSRCSIVVSIPACHAGDPGSIPGSGDFKFFFLGTRPPNTIYGKTECFERFTSFSGFSDKLFCSRSIFIFNSSG
uniref:Uncharacterized protein n=2 Tax=Physcomitrium patens TaxID=3218 RepID=A0A2K1JGG7_PHYPA|nr:hypothetical protein PHYPA_018056 [Physcomitrium patens]